MSREQMILEITRVTEPFSPSMDFLDDDSLRALYNKMVASIDENMIDAVDIWTILNDIVQSIGKSKYVNDIVFRGAFVLVSLFKLKGIGVSRFTEDVDMDWEYTDKWKAFYEELPHILTENSQLRLIYKYDPLSEGFSEEKMKLTLVAEKNGYIQKVFLDMSNRKTSEVINLQVSEVIVKAGCLYESICDKLSVFVTPRLGARIKDFYDIYLSTLVDGLELQRIIYCWKKAGYKIPDKIFGLSPENFDRMRKPFEIHSRLRFGNVSFDDVLERVVCFTDVIFLSLASDTEQQMRWSGKGCEWENER